MTCLLKWAPGTSLPMHKHPEIEQTLALWFACTAPFRQELSHMESGRFWPFSTTIDECRESFSVIAVEGPIDGRHADMADLWGGAPGCSGSVPLCVPEGQLVSSGHTAGLRNLSGRRAR